MESLVLLATTNLPHGEPAGPVVVRIASEHPSQRVLRFSPAVDLQVTRVLERPTGGVLAHAAQPVRLQQRVGPAVFATMAGGPNWYRSG